MLKTINKSLCNKRKEHFRIKTPLTIRPVEPFYKIKIIKRITKNCQKGYKNPCMYF